VTVVFLHALPFGGAMWRGLEDAGIGEAVRPTLYEFGATLDAWADAVLDLVPRGPLTLVGNSIGGSCAIEIAARVPSRIERLVLVGTKAAHRLEPHVRDEAIRVLFEEGVLAAWERFWRPRFGPAAAPTLVASAERMALEHDVDALVRGVRAFHARPDRATWIEGCDRPVIVIEGEHDVPARGRALARSAPFGTFHLVPHAGHYVPLETPRALADLMTRP
jgi:pimeloyl-ACP methyl ester carboxylesterase